MAQLIRMNTKKRVLVALSGGVDSSVSAMLLIEAGYAVEGAFIKTWTAPWIPCTWREERRDAMRVAAELHIPFHTVDLSKEYEEKVVHYLVDEYRKGRTPNPDVMCNKHIKFGSFFEWAMNKKFDFVATGHYARVECIITESSETEYHLLRGIDTEKDQSYFLWNLTQAQLSQTLFPVGHLAKAEVRSHAHRAGLVTASKKDSQGVCFLGKINMKDFLSHYIPLRKGVVLNTQGTIIGTHDGAEFLTLGQRHGFSVYLKNPDTPPLYVVEKNISNNTVTVSERDVSLPSSPHTIPLTEVHWIAKPVEHCQARLRYRQRLFSVTVTSHLEKGYSVTPHEMQPYVSEGQSIVFYAGDICLGGGILG